MLLFPNPWSTARNNDYQIPTQVNFYIVCACNIYEGLLNKRSYIYNAVVWRQSSETTVCEHQSPALIQRERSNTGSMCVSFPTKEHGRELGTKREVFQDFCTECLTNKSVTKCFPRDTHRRTDKAQTNNIRDWITFSNSCDGV